MPLVNGDLAQTAIDANPTYGWEAITEEAKINKLSGPSGSTPALVFLSNC
jgi:hypothetical protein